MFPLITFAQNNPIEPCSFESNNLWIKLVQLCPEGELVCDKVIYIGLNKKTGDFITLQGKTVVSKRNSNFLYYEFINNDTKYIIDRNNFLEIIKDTGGTPFFCKNIYNYLIINKKVLYKYKKRLLKLI